MCSTAKTWRKKLVYLLYLISQYLKTALLSLFSVVHQDETFTFCLDNPFPRYYADFFSPFVHVTLEGTVNNFFYTEMSLFFCQYKYIFFVQRSIPPPAKENVQKPFEKSRQRLAFGIFGMVIGFFIMTWDQQKIYYRTEQMRLYSVLLDWL